MNFRPRAGAGAWVVALVAVAGFGVVASGGAADARAAATTRLTARTATTKVAVTSIAAVTVAFANGPVTSKTGAPATTKAAKAAPAVRAKATAAKAPSVTVSPKGKSTGKPGKVSTNWSVEKPLVGWDSLPAGSWPESGQALTVVANKSYVDVRKDPSEEAEGLRFQRGQSVTGPVTFLAIQAFEDWVQVLLPVRPNDTVGWVRNAEVTRLQVTSRIVVELSSNTMIVERDGAEIYREKVSTGTGGTPTPTGLFYVRELLAQKDPSGPYGPYAFGLSGYSDVLVSFDGGEGAIGIHGTNRPDAIGTSVSHGCIRLTNEGVSKLFGVLPLGTPVEVVQSVADLPKTRRTLALPDPVFTETAGPPPASLGSYDLPAVVIETLDP